MNILKKAGLMVFSLLLLLLGLEVLLRVAPLPPPRDPAGDRSRIFCVTAPERSHPWTRNTTHVLRIAVIGDSFTAGVGVQKDDAYGARLERLLNLNTGVPPAEVHIFARAGTSTFQHKTLLAEALALQPDLVILGICLNDLEDWSHPRQIQRWRDEWLTPAPSPALAFCQRHSRLATLVASRLWARTSPRRCVDYYHHLYDPAGTGVQRFRAALELFRDECQTRQIALLPVVFPLMSFDFAPGRYPLQFAHDHILAICRELGLPVLDLLPAFRQTDPLRMQAVPGIDPHPSEIAHRLAAETILHHLVRHHIVAPGYDLVPHPMAMLQLELWHKTARRIHGLPPTAPDPPR